MTVARPQRTEPGPADAAGPDAARAGAAGAVAADRAVPGGADAGASAASWAGPALRRTAFAVGRRLRSVALAVSSAWQRSLQLRVATTTLVLTGTVVLVIGVFIVDQVAGGVLRAKRDAAVSQANIGLATARSVLGHKSVSSPADALDAQRTLQASLTASGRSAGLFTIEIESALTDLSQGPDVIPPPLRKVVQANNLAIQYTPVRPNPDSPATVPGLIVGEPVQARDGLFELYYLFPLTAEQQTIALLQRTVLLGGLGLVLLVVAIAMLVTRQVVRPVRVAAGTAGRLAAGDLSQRISVRGTDDIARLGRAFNDMAGSLQRQIRRLEDLSRLQRRFTSDVSHELRTPLTTVRMAAEVLHSGRDNFSPELARSAELLRAQLDQFESLLTDLLEISRYDAGVARLESETADMRGVVRNAVDASRVLAERQGSALVLRLPDAPVLVEMDSRRVERILRNLLGNAIDHGEGRPIEITVGHDEDAVAVTVRDHGVGLRPGDAGLVFNRFWRGDPSRSRVTGGTGLGLAISLEDARLHDGWLQAWGERGIGAQFRLTLPRGAGHTLLSSPLALVPSPAGDPE
jgi:two-component system, OmpR family, sensor histidine kinase MtrB